MARVPSVGGSRRERDAKFKDAFHIVMNDGQSSPSLSDDAFSPESFWHACLTNSLKGRGEATAIFRGSYEVNAVAREQRPDLL